MQRRLILIFCLILPISAPRGAPRRVTLEEALRLAEVSPQLAPIGLEVERARAGVEASGLWPNPELSFSREEVAGAVERFNSVTVPLPLTGRLRREREAARSGLDAAEARASLARVDLRARVREAFLDLLAGQGRSAALQEGLARLGDLVDVLRIREREGESSGYDRMRAERERAEVEAEYHGARGETERSREILAALIGTDSDPLEAEGTLETSGGLPDIGEVRRLARSRGDVTALEAQERQAEQESRAASRRRFPEPAITAGTKSAEEGAVSDTGSLLGISLSVPLFDRGQGGRATARAEVALLRARREALARQAEAEASSALVLSAARREAEAAYAAPEDPDDLARIARAAYEGGEMRILELLDAYRTALAVRLKTLELRHRARQAEVDLDRSLGREVTR